MTVEVVPRLFDTSLKLWGQQRASEAFVVDWAWDSDIALTRFDAFLLNDPTHQPA